jgi:GNAT superfamily N-acetyltransferase
MTIEIVRATLAHAKDIVAVMESAYRGESSRQGWTTEADLIDGARTSIDEISAVLSDPQRFMLVAHDAAQQILGCAEVAVTGVVGVFGKFAVSPQLQGGGLGKQLLVAAEQVAAQEFGVTVMKMTVIDGRKELEAFYERRGYQRTGAHVAMRDLHLGADMTFGHDLILNEYAKSLV